MADGGAGRGEFIADGLVAPERAQVAGYAVVVNVLGICVLAVSLINDDLNLARKGQ